jgi:hypothetical protein
MTDEMYLLDNNALSHLTRTQRLSEFFLGRCRLPTEVLHEAQGYPDAEAFEKIEYPTSARVLGFLKTVMASVPEGDTTLLNLYANKGAADPILVACALDGMWETSAYLFGPNWIIVSNDKAVRSKASELGVGSCTREEFLARTQDEWND